MKNLCNHFHISVQSLNNKVLKDMNRKYTKEDIFLSVDYIKKHIKDATFTCDIIVGFPKETDEEFQETLEGIKKISFLHVHTFKYSKRIKTRAAEMEGQVLENIKQTRSETLINISEKISNDIKEEYIGRTVEVLLETYKDGFLEGYTSNYIKVKVKGDEKLCGTHQKVELISQEKDIILGKI